MSNIIDIASARKASDVRDHELQQICDELTDASRLLADTMNALRDAVAQGCSGDFLIEFCDHVVRAHNAVERLSELGWQVGHRRISG